MNASFVTTAGVRISYRVDGPSGAAWLLLVNALGTELASWDSQIVELQRHFRVLRYDQRGHGLSARAPAPRGDYSLAELGGDAIALLDELGIARAHVAGVSIGGLIAQWLGIHAAARVERLVLCNTAARIGSREGWSERIAQVSQTGLAPLAAAALERWLSPEFRACAITNGATIEGLRTALVATSVDGYCGCCAALRDADLGDDLAQIAAETLVIAGRSDPVTTAADGRTLADRIRGARYVELESSHLSYVEAGEAFSAQLLTFLLGPAQGGAASPPARSRE